MAARPLCSPRLNLAPHSLPFPLPGPPPRREQDFHYDLSIETEIAIIAASFAMQLSYVFYR